MLHSSQLNLLAFGYLVNYLFEKLFLRSFVRVVQLFFQSIDCIYVLLNKVQYRVGLGSGLFLLKKFIFCTCIGFCFKFLDVVKFLHNLDRMVLVICLQYAILLLDALFYFVALFVNCNYFL